VWAGGDQKGKEVLLGFLRVLAPGRHASVGALRGDDSQDNGVQEWELFSGPGELYLCH
jgi:hypothetical protein